MSSQDDVRPISAPNDGPIHPLAPVEDCFVVSDGDFSYRLSAYYGPFVQNGYTDTGVSDRAKFAERPEGAENGLHWTSGSCPGQHGSAFFVAAPLAGDSEAPLPEDALAEFAARSAKAHGCTLST
ncbi:hypothetical protein RCO28_19200 [Streptomyces sp. LHD-70]|uniref:hypothetical protein n=1 Tax=Streptomyces sp. LHD-70 TaxID=3072140 RepID=UPI002810160E|nr:hypothetical protein [Streptomyces sp. LHD-70]MDQ8704599.1 hypothetical protein [Streptomyces sp. LHD-70]